MAGMLDEQLRQMRRVQAEQHLPEFIRQGWRHVETNPFASNWHVDAITDHLAAVADREIKRLIINIPPRHMKSLGAGVFFPAWSWAQNPDPDKVGHNLPIRPGTWRGPGVKFIFASYNKDLTIRDNVKARRLMDSEWYQNNWGNGPGGLGRVTFAADQNTKTYYENTRGGARLATSSDGVLTGHGADIFVIDDPHNVVNTESDVQRQAVLTWWTEAVPTRLNDAINGAFIVIMQRVHENDMCGHILASETGWTHLCLPGEYETKHPTPVTTTVRHRYGADKGKLWADPRTVEGEPLWPERYPATVLGEWLTRLGSYAFAGQVQQRPAPREGGFFKLAWFPIIKAAPVPVRRVRAWDLASSEEKQGTDPDWTVGALLAIDALGFVTVEHVVRLRGTALEVEAVMKQTAITDGYDVTITLPQDPGAAGKAWAQSLVRLLAGFDVRIVAPTGAKDVRARPFSAQAEAGNVRLLEGPWNRDYLDELKVFPKGRHDDQVDATSDAYNALAAPSRKPLFG
ncbi:phage terminase large subunit [uncultured Alsobacter sp.]|uniref:phage terminase large subunit n=1 Tax=uncultured Alsobacter sp. TaxID=1748258 RepID=UPI0025E7A186|nr:phage terminase large subunit [uncultured Alsobacter sp.]